MHTAPQPSLAQPTGRRNMGGMTKNGVRIWPVGKKPLPLHPHKAQMAESVDALVSNTSGETRPGSTPGLGTQERQGSPRDSSLPLSVYPHPSHPPPTAPKKNEGSPDKPERLSLFVSIFLECRLSENRFSLFWVYSQWGKPNLPIQKKNEKKMKSHFLYYLGIQDDSTVLLLIIIQMILL